MGGHRYDAHVEKAMYKRRQVKQRPLIVPGKSGAKYHHSPVLTSGFGQWWLCFTLQREVK